MGHQKCNCPYHPPLLLYAVKRYRENLITTLLQTILHRFPAVPKFICTGKRKNTYAHPVSRNSYHIIPNTDKHRNRHTKKFNNHRRTAFVDRTKYAFYICMISIVRTFFITIERNSILLKIILKKKKIKLSHNFILILKHSKIFTKNCKLFKVFNYYT